MNIAILCNEVKPIPAVEGGAVETLIELLLKNNEIKNMVNIDVYSKENQKAIKESKKYKNSFFYYIRYPKKLLYLQKIVNKVYRLLRIPNYLDFFCVNAARELRKKNYDWIIVENRPLFIFTLRRMGIKSKVALHLHNDFLKEDDYLTNEIVSQYDKILSVSEYLTEKIKANKRAGSKKKIHTFVNRVDTSVFANNIKENNSRKKDKIVLFHGRIIKEKGVYELIKAFNIAYREDNNLRLLIAGEFSDKKYYNKVTKVLSKTEHDNISLLGYLDHTSLAKVIHSADIVVLPSLWNEPFGLTIIESMAVGKPIISTRVGAIPEILSDAGIIVENDSELIRNLASEIVNLINNYEKQKKYSENAIKKVMSNYNADGYLEDLINILNQKEIG